MNLNSFQYLAYTVDPMTGDPKASMDAFYGPWNNEAEFRSFVSVNFPSSIPDGATVAVWNQGKTKLNEYYIYNNELRLKHDDSQGITETQVRSIVNNAVENIDISSEIDSAIDDLNSDISGQLNTLDTRLVGLENNSSSVNSRISNLENDSNTIDGRISNLENNSTNVSTQITNINNSLDTINNTISDIDIDEINDSVDGKLRKLSGDLSDKIDSDIQELSDDVDARIANIDIPEGGEAYDDTNIKNDIKLLRNKVKALSMVAPIDEDTEENYDATINNHLFVNNELHTESVVHLMPGYEYNIEGNLNGYIVIDEGTADQPTYINSHGLTIVSNKDYAIKNKSSVKLIIRLTNESITTLVSGQATDEGYDRGTIDSVGDLLIQGIAYLIIKNNRGHGINCYGNLKIVEVHLYISMLHHAINCDGDITLIGGYIYVDGIYTSGPQHAICIAENQQILRIYNYLLGKVNGQYVYCEGPNNAYYDNNLSGHVTANNDIHITIGRKNLVDIQDSIQLYDSLSDLNNSQNGTNVGTTYWDGTEIQTESQNAPNIYYNNESKYIKINGQLDKPLYAPNCTVVLENAYASFNNIAIPVITALRIITTENTYNKIVFSPKYSGVEQDLSQPGTSVNNFQIKDDSILIISGTKCANDATGTNVEYLNGDFILGSSLSEYILFDTQNHDKDLDLFSQSGQTFTSVTHKGNILAYTEKVDAYFVPQKIHKFKVNITNDWYGFTNMEWFVYNIAINETPADYWGGFCTNKIYIKKYQKSDLFEITGGTYSSDQLTLTNNIPSQLTFNINVLYGDSENTRRVRLDCNAAIMNTKMYTFDVEYKVGNVLYKQTNFETKSAYYAEDIIPIVDSAISVTVKIYKGNTLIDTVTGTVSDTIQTYAPTNSDTVLPNFYSMGSSIRFKTFSYYRSVNDYTKPMVYKIGIKYTYHPQADQQGNLSWTTMKVGQTWYYSDMFSTTSPYDLLISTNKNVSGEFGYSNGIRFIVYVSVFNNGTWTDIPSVEYVAGDYDGDYEFEVKPYSA